MSQSSGSSTARARRSARRAKPNSPVRGVSDRGVLFEERPRRAEVLSLSERQARCEDDVAEARGESSDAVMRRLFGPQDGTVDLGEGRTRVARADLTGVEIREYQNGRARVSQTAAVSQGKAVSGVRRFDARGQVDLEVRAEVDGVGQAAGEATSAMMQRDIRWRCAGRVIREMYDTVSVRVDRGGSESPLALPTADRGAVVRYSAVIQEYSGGELASLISLDVTSRGEAEPGGALSTFVIRYDDQGRQIGETAYSDVFDAARGVRKRRATLALSPDAQAASRAWGHAETPGLGAAAPGPLEMLGLTGEQVRQADALTAGDLLSLAFARACVLPAAFVRGVRGHMAEKSLQGLDDGSDTAQSAKWTVESTDASRLVTRREDVLAVERSLEPCRPGWGNASGALWSHARRSDHLEEIYDGSCLVRHARSSLREEAGDAPDGGCALVTRAKAVLVEEAGPAEGEAVFPGGLHAVDDTADAALQGLREAAGRVLGEVSALIGRMGSGR